MWNGCVCWKRREPERRSPMYGTLCARMRLFHTDRFLVRELSEQDRKLYCELFADPAVMRHVGRPLTSLGAAVSFGKLLQLTRRRFGPLRCFVVADRKAAQAVGIGSIQRIDREARRAEVGLVLRRRACGRGFGREILAGLIAHAFTALPVDVISARYSAAHPAVERMLDAVGFARREAPAAAGRTPGTARRSVTRDRWYKNDQARGGVDVEYHRISREDGP